ncbi:MULTISPECIES: DegV family protein [unclassified Romboutsia]|uniref:DegV family protein n=1 Tax=unclassified Romboutsia TaxID=2626894 RepID=UPI0008204A22|nr:MULTISPECIES: DegV family protein [unclassified Romboutsia]SCH51065.1 DegV domain-containing protein SAV1425 [uncultured Clostridium sp.]
MINNKIKVVCDGIANMPRELARQYNIEIVPLTINIDGKEYKDVDITDEEFYVMMREAKDMPKTSQATYIDFKEIFDRLVSDGSTVLYIAGSSKSSGTYQSAVLASKDVYGEIHIFDSMSISFGCGMLVLSAARMIEDGSSLDEVLNELEKLRDRVFVSMSMNSLEYLRKGGRISNGKALVGNMLSLRPMLTVKDGLIFQEGQVRGNKKIIPTIIKRTKEVCGEDFSDKVVAIGCGDNLEEREQLKEAVLRELNPKELIEITINPPMCSHSGPGFIGLTCFK